VQPQIAGRSTGAQDLSNRPGPILDLLDFFHQKSFS
jgi:hypothetical protein